MCVTGCPDLSVQILGTGDLLDIVKHHQMYHQKGSRIFKYLKRNITQSKGSKIIKRAASMLAPVAITGSQLRGGHRADGAALPARSSSGP